VEFLIALIPKPYTLNPMHVILRFLGTVAAVILTVYLVPGIVVTGGWLTIFLAALVWSVLVSVIKPVLQVIALPITVLTFGLFALVLNAFLFYIMAWLVPGFAVTSFLGALLGALVLSVLSWLIHQIL
jgi:putative membrane protein